uniref:Reticulophagy regulator 1 n=1 Tax=Homo sapiens TaxID=9606 RepID=A0A804HJZ6_HUMAN
MPEGEDFGPGKSFVSWSVVCAHFLRSWEVTFLGLYSAIYCYCVHFCVHCLNVMILDKKFTAKLSQFC